MRDITRETAGQAGKRDRTRETAGQAAGKLPKEAGKRDISRETAGQAAGKLPKEAGKLLGNGSEAVVQRLASGRS